MNNGAGSASWLPGIIGLILIVVGWVIVHHLTVVRERRREILDLKDRLVDRIVDVESRAIAFHEASAFVPTAARDLVSSVTRIAFDIAEPPFSWFQINPGLVVQFRRSVTYRNFDSSRFRSQPADSKVILALSIAAEELARAINHAYFDRYFARWWQAFRV